MYLFVFIPLKGLSPNLIILKRNLPILTYSPDFAIVKFQGLFDASFFVFQFEKGLYLLIYVDNNN